MNCDCDCEARITALRAAGEAERWAHLNLVTDLRNLIDHHSAFLPGSNQQVVFVEMLHRLIPETTAGSL